MTQRTIKVEAPELRLDSDRFIEPFTWGEAFGTDGPVEIEVGIGKGRFLLAAAAARPDVLHLGVECHCGEKLEVPAKGWTWNIVGLLQFVCPNGHISTTPGLLETTQVAAAQKGGKS